MLVLIASELVAHPEQRAIDRGAVVAGQFDNPGLDDKTAEFDEKPRPLTALDLPLAHVTSRPCRLMAVACRPVAPSRFDMCGPSCQVVKTPELLVQPLQRRGEDLLAF